jgi:tRNA pseudouridine55 synthase
VAEPGATSRGPAAASPAAEGVLVVDKPEGPTSHDVVGRVRRVLGEKRVGHAGTLDPLASGVVVVLVGRATRLSAYLTSDDKHYRATIRFGWATATYDREGDALAPAAPIPADLEARLTAALDARLGTHLQAPPAYSAKKIAGEAAHRLARRGDAVAPAAVPVTLKGWSLAGLDGGVATVDLHTSAGFYVRSLAHDAGADLGCGAHLAALRRTASGAFTLDDAVALPATGAAPETLRPALRPLGSLLADWPAAVLIEAGAARVRHGAMVGPDVCTAWPSVAAAEPPAFAGPELDPGFGAVNPAVSVRLLDQGGDLLALAAWRGGLLHPSVVLV